MTRIDDNYNLDQDAGTHQAKFKLEWVTPTISQMEVGDSQGSKSGTTETASMWGHPVAGPS